MARRLKLTKGQAAYVEHRLKGKEPQAAYAAAFPGATKYSLRSKPYVLENNVRVKAAIDAGMKGKLDQIQATVATEGVMGLAVAGLVAKEVVEAGLSRVEKRKILKRIATDRHAPRIDRLRAIQIDNLMTGDNKPVRYEGEITLHGIFLSLQKTTGLPDPNEVYELNGTNGHNGNGHAMTLPP